MLVSLPKTSPALGQIYLDILIAIAILMILAHALISLLLTSYELISFTRAKTVAKYLAQEKIELIRNLPYDMIGTQGGIPAGTLPQTEQIIRNAQSYTLKTSIIYIDDPFDNLAPDDTLPTDYKRVRVAVSWEGVAGSATNPVVFITDISPKGIETTSGGGTLSVLVFNAQGEPVPQALVKITASDLSPPVDLELETSDDGRVILPGTPVCIDCYQILAAKENYSSERTYSNEEVANPDKPHQTVLEGQLTQISFAIDKLSRLVIKSVNSREEGFSSLGNITFHLSGEKIIGTDINDQAVSKFSQDFTTNASGSLIIEDLEWDNYWLTLPDSSLWDISGTNPLLPVLVLPDQETNFKFSLLPHTAHSLLTAITNISQEPIASASAFIKFNSNLVASGSSGINGDPDFGQVFFPGLEYQTYQLEVTAAGYNPYGADIDVYQQTQETIILNPE